MLSSWRLDEWPVDKRDEEKQGGEAKEDIGACGKN